MKNKVPLLAVIALILYASQNVILEQKLSKFNVFAILLYFYAVTIPLAFAGLIATKALGQQILVPNGKFIWIAVGVGILYFVADTCYVGAYTSGGSLFTITSIVIMFPVFASIIRYFWVGGLPNLYHIASYLLALGAIILSIKGNNK